MPTLGIYVHIPFCRQKCLYCDFCSYPSLDSSVRARYAERMRHDLALRAPDAAGYTVDSVYFGGGTPTVMEASELVSLLDCIRAHYRLAPDAEITLECNPATATEDDLAALRRGGFNRISLGLQSTHESELRALGRIHSFSDFCKTYEAARAAGFSNISADLMSGLPGQTPESWLASIERLCALAPEHISAYGLIVEEGTPFFEMRDKLHLPDEDAARQMYLEGIEALAAHGYAQYEISNFARVGYESRHNLKYWSCEEYLGFGPAAYSDFGGHRFGNARDLDAYLDGKSIECERESPSRESRIDEYVMLRMRLCEGVREDAFRRRFGQSFLARFSAPLERYAKMGLVRITPEGAAFTPEGFYVSNAILSDLLDFSD